MYSEPDTVSSIDNRAGSTVHGNVSAEGNMYIAPSPEMTGWSKITQHPPRAGRLLEDREPVSAFTTGEPEAKGQGAERMHPTRNTRSLLKETSGTNEQALHHQDNVVSKLQRRVALYEEYDHKLPHVPNDGLANMNRVSEISKDSRTYSIFDNTHQLTASSGYRFVLDPFPSDPKNIWDGQMQIKELNGSVFILAWTTTRMYISHHPRVPGFTYDPPKESVKKSDFKEEVLPFIKHELNPLGSGPGLLQKDDNTGEFKMKDATVRIICPAKMTAKTGVRDSRAIAKYSNVYDITRAVESILRSKPELVLYQTSDKPNQVAKMTIEWSEKERRLRAYILDVDVLPTTKIYGGRRIIDEKVPKPKPEDLSISSSSWDPMMNEDSKTNEGTNMNAETRPNEESMLDSHIGSSLDGLTVFDNES